MIFDPDTQRPIEEPSRPPIVQDALPGMKEGYAEHFVGRRREQQRLLPALRSGDLQIVIITGIGGSGKSALATKLARKLETYGFIPIPVPSSKENPLNSARLLQAFGDAFREAARKHRSEGTTRKANELDALVHDLKNPELTVEDRLHDVVGALNHGQFLLLLDNFESNMDESDRHILDAEISGFYQYLLGNLTGGSRAIITTRYPPSDVLALPPKAHREDLSDFAESSFLKILQRDPQVEQRIRSSELPMDLLRDLYSKFGGTPRFLLQIREAIKEMETEVLKVELAKVELSSDNKTGELQEIRDKYFDDIFTERLYGYLSPESQIALSRSAVYGVPVTMEGLAAAAGGTMEGVEAFAQEWKDGALAYEETGKALWSVYGLLRSWLLEKLSSGERKKAHKAAGDFLYGLLQQRTETSLDLYWVDCLLESRIQYILADEFDKALNATNILSSFYINNGLYEDVRNLNHELLKYQIYHKPFIWIGESYQNQGNYSKASEYFNIALSLEEGRISLERAVALQRLAVIDRKKGNYEQAQKRLQEMNEIELLINSPDLRVTILKEFAMIDHDKGELDAAFEKFSEASKIERTMGKKTISPSTFHNLGSIYLDKGKHDEALEKLLEALKIEQRSGDKHGEGMTFSKLGLEALWGQRLGEGLRLLGLSAMILKAIGHVSFDEVKPIVEDLSHNVLNYTQEQLDGILRETAEAYKSDNGWGLIEAAFGKG